MLAGLIRDDERKMRDGIPGLSDIPAIGHLFGHSSNERNQTDVIVMLTPRIVRVLELTEEDLRGVPDGTRFGGGGAAPSRLAHPPAASIFRLPEDRQPMRHPSRRRDVAGARRNPARCRSRRSQCCRRRRRHRRRRTRAGDATALDMLPVLPPIVARACAHGTRVAICDRKGHLHLRAARSRLGSSGAHGFSAAATISTRPASRFLSRRDSSRSPCNGASGAPAASPSRCRCRTRRPSSTI